MKQSTILLFSLGVLVLLLLLETHAVKNGCKWSGCTYSSSRCKTGVTGGSGRPNPYADRRKCSRWFRRPNKDFCCDTDCGHQKCGKTCDDLKMQSYSEVASKSCTEIIPGYGSFNGISQFCCPV